MRASSSKIRLALLSGGRSGEHEISLRSAHSIRQALDPNKYTVFEFFITPEGKWNPRPILPEPGANPDIDVVFPALHGTFGEDGTIQGLLELADLPYVSAGVLGSAASMDKSMTKRLCSASGLPIVPYLDLVRPDARLMAKLMLPFAFPVFVKPVNLGSSVGISKANAQAEFVEAVAIASRYDQKVIVEKAVKGREFECAVLGGDEATASAPCEILPSREFYTFEDKYLLNEAHIELPAKLSSEQTAEMQSLARAAFRAVGCEIMGRVDFLMDGESGQLYINEINTVPGFTSISMFPKMWEHSGLPYAALLDRLIHLALERARARRQLQYSR